MFSQIPSHAQHIKGMQNVFVDMKIAPSVQKLIFYDKEDYLPYWSRIQPAKNIVFNKMDKELLASNAYLGVCPLPSSRSVFNGDLPQPGC